VGDAGEADLASRQEGGDALGQERVEEIGLLDPEVGQGVVVDADPATQPAIRVVLVAQAVECPRRADALQRGVQPERDEDGRIDRGPPRVALDRPDPSVERREVEALDEGPHQARPVVGRKEALEIGGPERDLAALRTLESWSRPSLGLS
jgi:hypothetical protein